MNKPKISVLIPMYNRKHYIENCINSVLNQTFQDYEIIIRDDGSKDGSADFVAERYSAEISSGKIRLERNKKNIGEWETDNRLIRDALGKYIAILHSDDMYLPHALAHLYEVAEKHSADVVHSSFFLNLLPNLKAYLSCQDKNPVQTVTLMSEEPSFRFSEWTDIGTFFDAQYNLFNRKFLLENDLFFKYSNRFFALWWIMLAKVFVKTPVVCYVYRNAPDSKSNTKHDSADYLENCISSFIKMSRDMDECFSKIDFFKDNVERQYIAKACLFQSLDAFQILRLGLYKDGVTPEFQRTVASAFKKYFGDDYFYPAFLFHLAHTMPYGKKVDKLTPPHCQKTMTFEIYFSRNRFLKKQALSKREMNRRAA